MMRTILTIDVDSERNPQINLSKPLDMIPNSDSDGLKEVVLNDIVALTETLCLLVETAGEKGYMPKEALIRNLNSRFNEMLD
jgi:hypothetical protein